MHSKSIKMLNEQNKLTKSNSVLKYFRANKIDSDYSKKKKVLPSLRQKAIRQNIKSQKKDSEQEFKTDDYKKEQRKLIEMYNKINFQDQTKNFCYNNILYKNNQEKQLEVTGKSVSKQKPDQEMNQKKLLFKLKQFKNQIRKLQLKCIKMEEKQKIFKYVMKQFKNGKVDQIHKFQQFVYQYDPNIQIRYQKQIYKLQQKLKQLQTNHKKQLEQILIQNNNLQNSLKQNKIQINSMKKLIQMDESKQINYIKYLKMINAKEIIQEKYKQQVQINQKNMQQIQFFQKQISIVNLIKNDLFIKLKKYRQKIKNSCQQNFEINQSKMMLIEQKKEMEKKFYELQKQLKEMKIQKQLRNLCEYKLKNYQQEIHKFQNKVKIIQEQLNIYKQQFNVKVFTQKKLINKLNDYENQINTIKEKIDSDVKEIFTDRTQENIVEMYREKINYIQYLYQKQENYRQLVIKELKVNMVHLAKKTQFYCQQLKKQNIKQQKIKDILLTQSQCKICSIIQSLINK